MDFDELLNEVEGAIQGASSSAKRLQCASGGGMSSSFQASSNQSNSVARASTLPHRGRPQQKNELDDLLDMVTDAEQRHHSHSHRPAPVHPHATPTHGAAKSVRGEAHAAGGAKKCSQLLLAGEASKRGLNSAFNASTACSNLRCNECDFTVVQFPGKKWSASADYMFFRENVPSEAKLRARMEFASGFTAYACQCKWLSVASASRVDSGRVKWSCAGH